MHVDLISRISLSHPPTLTAARVLRGSASQARLVRPPHFSAEAEGEILRSQPNPDGTAATAAHSSPQTPLPPHPAPIAHYAVLTMLFLLCCSSRITRHSSSAALSVCLPPLRKLTAAKVAVYQVGGLVCHGLVLNHRILL